MAPSSSSYADGHRRRNNAPTSSRSSRVETRPAYPGATPRSRPSTPRSAAGTRPKTPAAPRQHTNGAPATPTPATVWTCGPEPVDARAPWPTPIVETLVAAFTDPGAHVTLLTPDPVGTCTDAPSADVGETDGQPECGVLDVVRALNRDVDVATLIPHAFSEAGGARPFWASLPTSHANPAAALAATAPTHGLADSGGTRCQARADLVLASLPSHAADTLSLHRIARAAATQLRAGGIFAVYTHSDSHRGRLIDPTGDIVAACQHADLLYLQHIVALHTPIRAGHLHSDPSPAHTTDHDRAHHRAHARGLPAPHLRVHSDILVFAQPSETDTSSPDTGATDPTTVASGDPS
ncbi:hypothetical protein LY12_003479 [Prauserella alba]|nr:hypothetical protein [Prauserella alba]